ncbi:MAG: dephospho-CoA kinase [Gammaproteobacteria bacterium]
MLKIGLTGGIASGKSEAARAFSDLGVPVIDSDDLALEVSSPGNAGFAEIVAAFGPEYLDDAGRLDRQKLRSRVFADHAALKRLEAIVHPRVRALLRERLVRLAVAPYVVIVIPLLIETGMAKAVDRVLVVDCPEATQIARLRTRDRATEADARAILATQASRSARLTAADDVIVNDAGRDRLRGAVNALHERYLQMAKA